MIDERSSGNAFDDERIAVPLDPRSLTTDETVGIRVRPKHLREDLREFADIANHPFSERFPLEVEESERLRGLFG